MSNEGFEKIFYDRADMFIRTLKSIGNGFSEVASKPIDGSFILGWQFEQGVNEEPWKSSGNIEYAVSYCKHMISQGLSVAFAATYEI